MKKGNNIESQARNFARIPIYNKKYRAVVHLEDEEDKVFWDRRLQQVQKGRYLYITHSKNAKGVESTGCRQCLLYKGHLSKSFFICIDSDFRQLWQEEGLTSDYYIAQTHTYSWENHQCEAIHLQERLTRKVPASEFDFRIFLTNLSYVLYRPLLYLIHYSKDRVLSKEWNISLFNACMPAQPDHTMLMNNGEPYIHYVKERFDSALSGLKEEPLSPNAQLTEANAYLHIQGHHLFHLVNHIGSMIYKEQGKTFADEILNASNHLQGYAEIDDVKSDLKMILE